ncbi:MAG: bifunctional 5,10-methylene-tetrahydrofolate dehydrogenase/5,10-methylene-tetrahydrofolate cyclohydrolase [Thermoplasmatales archaeon SG8-52-3]|nr:MAG: bifunctional 5,10-methylene-tetrahydrofolate dehydrogenase/5,10-methylene-tetrahydrofolate cyclohydrolase [Thermoplasmatales archaeon SG8-52-3]
MTAKEINGRKIASELKIKIAKEVEGLKSKYKKTPKITTIIIGNDSSSELYLRLRDKACNEVGIISNHLEFKEDITEKKVLENISNLNNDKNVHGILIQLPLPAHLSQTKLINAIDSRKDVEGLHPYNIGKTLNGDEYIVPITPLSVLTILEHEKTELKGKNVVIINHSNHVGKPLAALMLNRNATVTICHVFTKDLKKHTMTADVLISATGINKLINSDFIKNGATIIDVGIINTKDGICGDVDYKSTIIKAGKITPVPGGVGPVTVACSLINMIKTFKNCVDENE